MKIKRSIAALASMAMLATAAAAAVPMSAGAAYDTLLGEKTTTMDKYLVMDIGANVPKATFNFALTSYDSTKDAGALLQSDTSYVVFNGVTSGAVTSVGTTTGGAMTFAPTDDTVVETAENSGKKIAWVTTDTDEIGDEKCATKSVSFDFSNVSFSGPGVYRYLITESGDNMAVSNDIGTAAAANKVYRTLDVFVNEYAAVYATLTDEEKADTTKYPAPSGTELYISSYTMYQGKHDAAPTSEVSTAVVKSDSYTNQYTTHDLTIGKNVAGNQASKDKYFKFTVKLENAVAGTVYDVSYGADTNDFTTDGSADKNIAANPNAATTCITEAVAQPDSLTVKTDGTIQQDFYLKHGQTIVIRGLAENTKYTVGEDEENYSSQSVLTVVGATSVDSTTGDVECTGISGDDTVSFTNTLSGLLPTGIILSVAGPAVVGIIALLGIAVLLIRGRRRRAEEE